MNIYIFREVLSGETQYLILMLVHFTERYLTNWFWLILKLETLTLFAPPPKKKLKIANQGQEVETRICQPMTFAHLLWCADD